MLAHLTNCPACGITLRLAAEAIHGEAAVEESLHGLPPVAVQAELARKLAGEPVTPPSKRGERVIAMPERAFVVWKWGAVAAAAAVMAGAWWWGTQPDVPVEALLAQAYTERRPTEFRIPGGGVAPVRVDRAAQATFQRPASLIDAENKIAQALKSKSRDGRWLQWKARAEMLEFEADEAISTLNRALEARPGDGDVLADLGSAYAQRAERADQAGAERSDWSQALDKLSQALRAQPAASVALYNRALVHEKLSMVTEAITDWERYLDQDGSSAWAEEARKHLAALEQKKNNGKSPVTPIGTSGGSARAN